MAGIRGRAHQNRTENFPPDKEVRASLVLAPGDPVRDAFAELVADRGVSRAEVLREAILDLHEKMARRSALKEAG